MTGTQSLMATIAIRTPWRTVAPALALMTALSAAPDAHGQAGDELSKKLLQDAPARWAEYTHRAQSLQGRVDSQGEGPRNGDGDQGSCVLKANGKNRLLTMSMVQTSGGKREREIHEVIGFNHRYAFALRRKTESSPWVVKDLTIAPGGTAEDYGGERTFGQFQMASLALMWLDGELLETWLQKPEFHVLRSRLVTMGGEDLVEVTFDCTHKPDDRGYGMQGGQMVLDPKRFWCLRNYDIRTESQSVRGTRKSQVLEIAELEGGFPVPKRIVRERHATFTTGKTNVMIDRFEFHLEIPHDLPDESEFTLSAFGLPEPPGLDRLSLFRRIPIYYWIAGTGIVILVLGISARRLLAKRIRTATSPS